MYIRVTTTYNFRKYLRFSYRLAYFSNPKLFFIFVIAPIIGIIFTISIPEFPDKLPTLLFFVALILPYPIYIYFGVKKKYISKLLHPLVVEFTENKMILTSTSINRTILWDDASYLIKEYNNWLVLYTLIGNHQFPLEMIPKDQFTKEQLEELKESLTSQNNMTKKWLK